MVVLHNVVIGIISCPRVVFIICIIHGKWVAVLALFRSPKRENRPLRDFVDTCDKVEIPVRNSDKPFVLLVPVEELVPFECLTGDVVVQLLDVYQVLTKATFRENKNASFFDWT